MHGTGQTPRRDERLYQLAREHGLEESYTDITGQVQEASPEILRGVLTALGVPVDHDDDVEQALRLARTARWSRLLEPVIVAWEGEGTFSLHLPASVDRGRYALTLTPEDGEGSPRLLKGRLEDHPVEASDELDGRRFVARQLTLPGPLPHGYHRLELRVEGGQGIRGEALVLSAPLRAYVPPDFDQTRHWGVFLPLYALHSQRSPGAGDLGDLGDLMAWVGERGGSVVGTLPLLAAFLDEPHEWSPYAPASRLAWNELYLHLEALPEYNASAKARALYEGPQAQAERERLRQAPLVDYRAQMSLKRRVIAAMAESCFQAGSTRRAQLEAFAAERPEIDDYARFRAVTDAQRVIWPQWSQGLRSGTIGAADFDPADHRTHLYAQWGMHQQLSALRDRATGGLGLYLDLPVGVNGCGYDTWRYGDLYVRELSTGAPPDTLFGGGQNWAFPPLHPERLREQGYGHLIDVVRNHLRYAGVLRIDHVMGLHRLYVIPQGASAKQGIYLRYRPEELYAIVAIESHRARCLVVGEDLGTVPDAVREAMQRHRVHKIHVVQYVASDRDEQALPKAPPDAVAGINTHDMPPFAAFWSGTDIDDRMELGWIDHEQARAEHAGRTRLRANIRRFLSRELTLAPDADASATLAACLQHLGRSDSRLVLASLEDLWGELHPQNVPGTYLERPNWKRRAKLGLEEITTNPDVARVLSGLHRARKGLHDGVSPVRHDVTRLTAQDVYLFNEGTHERIYDKLGAHCMEVDGREGTYFAVWAPGATYVSVVGDFNGWDRGLHPLRMHGPSGTQSGNQSGIWEGFVPGVAEGALYKLHIAGHDGWSEDKSDPVGFGTETPPLTASVVTRSRHAWSDAAWMEQRAGRNDLQAPMSIYEVHLGSWRRVPEEGDRFLGYRELAPLLVEHCRTHGFTHVELMPVMEHPFFGSWGYQVTGYFAPSSRFGSPDDLRWLIDQLHQAEIGVILDWVPSHFPADAHGLAYFDGTHLYEHADPRQGFHPDWQSAIFNYGRHEVRSFLISSALFWLDQFHADGLRVDGVASMLYLDYSRAAGEWVPNVYGGRENLEAIGFLRRLNEAVYQSFPGVQTIAEESTAWPLVSRPTHLGGLGFGLKWDMGWMHDTLRYLAHDPIHRRWHQNELTFRLIYAFNESFVLSLSHDEVVHGKGSMLGKMPGDKWQKFANLRALYGYMWGQPGKKHLFMGQEFGQLAEWNHDRSLDWHLLQDPLHAGLQRWVGDLNHLYRELPSLHQWDCDPRGFEWIDFHDATFSVYSFMRRDEQGGLTIIVLNFTPVPRHDYRVGVPREGWWAERLNSDATTYGGSGVGNNGGVHADPHPAHERPFSVCLQLPPLGVLFLHQPAPDARGE